MPAIEQSRKNTTISRVLLFVVRIWSVLPDQLNAIQAESQLPTVLSAMPLAQLDKCQKGSKRGSVTLRKQPKIQGPARRRKADVKKVPNGRLQGLDPVEIVF